MGQDEHDRKAAELLLCFCSSPFTFHYKKCPADFRPAVAADRRAQAEAHKAEVEKLNQTIHDLGIAYTTENNQLKAEVERITKVAADYLKY